MPSEDLNHELRLPQVVVSILPALVGSSVSIALISAAGEKKLPIETTTFLIFAVGLFFLGWGTTFHLLSAFSRHQGGGDDE